MTFYDLWILKLNIIFSIFLITGLLREAAIVTDNQAILLQIGDKDCVAIETRYHNGCYKKLIYQAFPKKAQQQANQ